MTDKNCLPWTAEMDEFLLAFWGLISKASICQALEIDLTSLNENRLRLNLGAECGFLSNEVCNWIQDYRDAFSIREMSRQVGISEDALQLAYSAFDIAAENEIPDDGLDDKIPEKGVYGKAEKEYVKSALKAGCTRKNIAIWLNRELEDAECLIRQADGKKGKK